MDGKIIIGTEIDEKGFDKKYQQLKTRLENEEINLEIKTTNVEMAKRQLEEANKRVVDLKKEYDGLDNTIKGKTAAFNALKEQMNTGEISGEQYRLYGLLNSELSGLKARQEEYFKSYDKLNEKINKSNDLLSKEEAKLEIQKNKVEQIRSEFQQLNSEIALSGNENLVKMDSSTKNVGKSLKKITKKVAKWGLAVFGVRSAYMAIRRAISTVSQYNDQIKTDIAYIQFALASALEPIIKVIIGLAYKLLGVLNAISIALFNYNLFQNASINKFKKMNAGASKLKKTLAGFDEMNVLSDSGSGGGVGGATMPSMEFDTSLGEKFLSFWRGIIQFWENDWLEAFNSLTGQWATFFQGIGMIGKGFYDILKGIFETIKGAFQMLIALFKGDTSALYEGLKTMLSGLTNIFKGIIEINIGVFKAAVGLVKGILVELVTVIYNNVIKPIGEFFANLWSKMVSGVKTAFNSITSFFSNIISKIMGMFKKIGSTAGDVVGKAFKAVINAVLKTIEKILNTPIKAINSLIKTINKVPGINLGKLETFTLPRLAKGGIVNMPGRGVPVGGALAGEVNREGVIPLTDSQQMALLGEAIGRYVNINATIPVYVGNRQIAREIQRIQSENDFAFNR